MKKIYLILLLPFLVATQCEDDYTGFETNYLVQNNSSIDLFLLTEEGRLVEIESQSTLSIGSTLNSITSPILPSESFVFSNIKLYATDNDNFILIYIQDPIDDDLWIFSEPTMNRFEYKLLITNDVIE
ncbi:MAG: hypothetical protein KJO26_01855 [Deltaproteobacteria bacterium]|nr:hypothetical protein [Deltaproteobacteria bacterium]